MEKKDRIKKDISRESYLQTVIRRFKQHHLATVSLVILAVLVVAALLAPIIAPYNPDEIVGGFSKAPTAEHWLGTDQIGRDVLSRLLYATRISLLVGVLATAISTVIGVILGLIAGYFGGAADMIIMRFTDMVMSFPYILLVLVAASIFKPGLWSIILILGFVDWPGILLKVISWQECRFRIFCFPRFCRIPLRRFWCMQRRFWRCRCWMRRHFRSSEWVCSRRPRALETC